MQKRVWGRERVGERDSASAREGILNHITYAPHRPRWAACELCFCVSRGAGGQGWQRARGVGGTPLVCCGHNGSSLSSYWSWSCRLLCTGYGLHVPRCCVINWPCCIWVASQVAEWRQPTPYIPIPPFISLCPTPAAPFHSARFRITREAAKVATIEFSSQLLLLLFCCRQQISIGSGSQQEAGRGGGRTKKALRIALAIEPGRSNGNLCWMCETV